MRLDKRFSSIRTADVLVFGCLPSSWSHVTEVRGPLGLWDSRSVLSCKLSFRVPKMARGKISLARGIHCFPSFFCTTIVPILYRIRVYIHTYLTPYRPCMNCRRYQITLQWNIFPQTWSGAKCWLGIYHWGTGLAVIGRVRDIGRNILQSALKQEALAAPVTARFSPLSPSSRRPLLEI